MTNPETGRIEAVFAQLRQALGVREDFPPEVEREAAEAARRDPAADPGRVDRTAVPLITIDPPGSRDLDQAFCLERAEDGGFRLWYAIADVGFFVDRGGAVEAEAWQRGVTFYAPDRRVPLYPPVLGQDAASLLPEVARPSVLFRLDLDARAEIRADAVERALVRSRRQLTYTDALEHVRSGGERYRGEEWCESLLLLRPFGELRRERERDRGGVSLPIVNQHVQKETASRLGYAVEYERPTASEQWNAQMSLLTGHAAARRMLAAGVGLLRTMPPPDPHALERFRRIARAMGFEWPDEVSYGDFLRWLDLEHPRVGPLLWQARRVGGGADYTAFDGAAPAVTDHSALAMPYAHVTAPLRRLADRYVLDLLVELAGGAPPSAAARETLTRLPPVMNETETKEGKLERKAVDVAEAWMLRGREGERFRATVLGVRDGKVEVQIEHPPVRVTVDKERGDRWLELGDRVEVRLTGVRLEDGWLDFDLPE
ncbi:MAG TPA: RNB domain-containing ribonuclease [Longimicrobiaceae bacterium]|nr:RNB domain-containing ribonuclease [Longimicrobiaceae bacterium]